MEGQSLTIGITPLRMAASLREFRRVPGLGLGKAILLFDAGYRSLAAVRAATRQEISEVEGLEPADLDRLEEAARASEMADLVCPSCETPLPRAARRCPRCSEPVTTETVRSRAIRKNR